MGPIPSTPREVQGLMKPTGLAAACREILLRVGQITPVQMRTELRRSGYDLAKHGKGSKPLALIHNTLKSFVKSGTAYAEKVGPRKVVYRSKAMPAELAYPGVEVVPSAIAIPDVSDEKAKGWAAIEELIPAADEKRTKQRGAPLKRWQRANLLMLEAIERRIRDQGTRDKLTLEEIGDISKTCRENIAALVESARGGTDQPITVETRMELGEEVPDATEAGKLE